MEEVGGTSLAGIGQALSVLGAALAAIPLARLAVNRGRRASLALGYAIAILGGLGVLWGALTGSLALLLAGLLCFGCGQATNLQSRYAATDAVPPQRRARAMSLVVWATTVGVVLGPNLSVPGEQVADALGLAPLSGPFVFSIIAFAVAGIIVVTQYPRSARQPRSERAATIGGLTALRWAASKSTPRTGVLLLAGSQATMVALMVMTPLHMDSHGLGLPAIGLVISVHTLGMYAFSPLVGLLVERLGAARTGWIGAGLLLSALLAALGAGGSQTMIFVSLFLLGLGWSAGSIAGSAMIAATPEPSMRISLQGAADACLNYAGAGAAALAGPVFASGGFSGLSLLGAAFVAVAILGLATSTRRL